MNENTVPRHLAESAPAQLHQQAELGMAALELIDLGVFGVDGHGRLYYANHAARELARAAEVLAIRAGRLRCVGSWNRACFEQVLARVAIEKHSASLRLQGSGAVPESVIVMTRACSLSGATQIVGDAPDRVLVIVDQPERRRLPDAGQLRELFELTAAESRVARALAMGLSLEGYAAAHGLQLSTARSQLRAVLRKTGCNRQQTLIRLLVGIPAAPH